MSIDPGSSSVAELRQAMADGRLTATALTRHFLARIEELNPALHAVITVNHDAIAEAAASDDAWESGQPRGPLEGIPVLVKDNVQVAGMPTTAGSLALLPALPAGCLHRLPAARGGRGDPGEGEPVGVGELPVDPLEQRLVVSRRAGQQPVRARQEPVRVELGVGGRRVGRAGAAGGGHRDRRLDRLPVERLRRGRRQADGRPGEPDRDRAAVPGPGHRGADGQVGRRRGRDAVRARRRRPGRSRRLRAGRLTLPPTTPSFSTRPRSTARGSASGGAPPPGRTPPRRCCSKRRCGRCGRSARW